MHRISGLKTFFCLALFGLTGCMTVTPYQPLGAEGGYSDQRLEANRFRVSFAGNSLTARQTVQDYLLYRAAELTLANGHDYFVVLGQHTAAKTTEHQSFSFGTGFGRWHWYPRAGVGVTTTTTTTAFVAETQIRTFAGAKPQDNPDAFDAHQLRSNLEPVLVRPEAKKTAAGAEATADQPVANPPLDQAGSGAQD